MNVVEWLLDASIRWQMMRATEGWGARLLALQDPGGPRGGAAWKKAPAEVGRRAVDPRPTAGARRESASTPGPVGAACDRIWTSAADAGRIAARIGHFVEPANEQDPDRLQFVLAEGKE